MKNRGQGLEGNGKISKNTDYLKEYIGRHQQQFNKLSEKEIQLITLVSRGVKDADIANHLEISEAELQESRTSLSQQLSLHTESEFIKFALAFGLISF